VRIDRLDLRLLRLPFLRPFGTDHPGDVGHRLVTRIARAAGGSH
jgi:hypothetical protein